MHAPKATHPAHPGTTSGRPRQALIAASGLFLAITLGLLAAPPAQAFIDAITVSPAHPSLHDSVRVTVHGWVNICSDVSPVTGGDLAGNEIRFDVDATLQDPCMLPAMLEYGATRDFGPLPPGSYKVVMTEHLLVVRCSDPPQCTSMAIFDSLASDSLTFEVVECSAQWAVVTLSPAVLNSASSGRWLTAYIEFPSGPDPATIDPASIQADGVPAEPGPAEVGDEDGDGVPDLMVKFPRAPFAARSAGEYEVQVVGGSPGGCAGFAGSAHLTVVSPPGITQRSLPPVVRPAELSVARDASGLRIHYILPVAGPARIELRDVQGRMVRALVSGELPAGAGEVRWDLRGEGGQPVASGIYFCHLVAGGQQRVQRASVIR